MNPDNPNLLPRKPKFSFRRLKQGASDLPDLNRKFVLVPAEKVALNGHFLKKNLVDFRRREVGY